MVIPLCYLALVLARLKKATLNCYQDKGNKQWPIKGFCNILGRKSVSLSSPLLCLTRLVCACFQSSLRGLSFALLVWSTWLGAESLLFSCCLSSLSLFFIRLFILKALMECDCTFYVIDVVY